MLLDHLEHTVFEGELLAWGRHGVVLEGHIVELTDAREVGVVAHDQRNVDRQLTGALTVEQIVEAVAGLRDQYEGAQGAVDDVEVPGHAVVLSDGGECRLEAFAGDCRLDLEAHEKGAGVVAGELLRLGDVALRFDDGAADGVHNSRPVFADEGEDPVRRVHTHKGIALTCGARREARVRLKGCLSSPVFRSSACWCSPARSSSPSRASFCQPVFCPTWPAIFR